MKLTKIEEIAPRESVCIEVDSEDRLFAAGGTDGKSIVSHNSVVQRNIILGCILRPESWRFCGIDLKKVELSSFRDYSNVVLGVATTLEDALTVLRFARETMMKRYAELEQLGYNNFLDLPDKGAALLVMVDEAGELLTPSGVKALSEHTFIPTANSGVLLKNLEVGDVVLDNNMNETVVTQKYEPTEQTRYDMKIVEDETGKSENFVSGSEHNWVAYFKHPNGEVTGPKIVDTTYLYNFKKNQERFPIEERVQVKFKRNGDFSPKTT